MFRQQEGQPGGGLSACSLLPSYSVIPPALPHSQNLAVDRHGTLGPTLDLMSHNLNFKKNPTEIYRNGIWKTFLLGTYAVHVWRS